MRLRVLAAAVPFCLLGIATVASAQDAPPVPGARIRLTVPCELVQPPAPERRNFCTLVGKLGQWRPDAIDLEVDGRRSSYNLSTVSRLEVSRGSRSHKLLGAGIGFVVGVGATYHVFNSGASSSGSTSACNQSANQDAIDSSACLGIYGLGGLVGAGLGAFVGSRFREELWQSVPYGRVRISLVTQRRLTVKLAVAF